jgi:hypothetical protein
MSITQITGQYLINMTNDLLGGYQNGIDSRAMLTHLNNAKDEIWSVTKELHDEYFQTFSQYTDPTLTNYFPQLATNLRSYTLPEDCRSIEFVEVQNPTTGGPIAVFTYAKLNSPAFKEERERSNELGGPEPNGNCQKYLYSIAGHDQFILASYPSQPYILILWYTASVADFEATDVVNDILFPFSKKMAEYAAKACMMSMQDPAGFAAWTEQWKTTLINLVQGSGDRNDADPQFVTDFTGDDY